MQKAALAQLLLCAGLSVRYLAILLCMLFLLSACGRKALPLPPGKVYPTAGVVLEGVVANDQAELSWYLDEKAADFYSDIELFYLYRAVLPRSEKQCLNCPLTFERIAEISSISHQKLSDGKRLWRYAVSVDSSLRYIFKINVLSSGNLGPDSNYVELEP